MCRVMNDLSPPHVAIEVAREYQNRGESDVSGNRTSFLTHNIVCSVATKTISILSISYVIFIIYKLWTADE